MSPRPLLHALAAVLVGLLGACTRSRVSAHRVFADSSSAALAEAAAAGDTGRIRRLVAAGADPDARGDDGVNLLQWALLNRSTLGMAGLLDNGARPAGADSAGKTVMHYAAMANDPRYLEVLLAHRADPNTPDAVTLATPLESTIMWRREEQFRALLRAGADVSRADRFGDTPLHAAAKINAVDRVLDLLEAGADPRARNQRGNTFQRYLNMTPVDVQSEDGRRGRAAITAWLEAHGVKSEIR